MANEDDTLEPKPSPNEGAEAPVDAPLNQKPIVSKAVDYVSDHTPAPGDDSIQETASPVDFLPVAEGAQALAKGVGMAADAVAPVASRLIADEAGVLKLPRSGPFIATDAEAGPGLIQKAQSAVGQTGNKGLEEAKQLVEQTYGAVQRGEMPMSQFQAAVQRYNRLLSPIKQAAKAKKNGLSFAEGGEVSPEQTQSAFDASGQDQLPTDPNGLLPQVREPAQAESASPEASGPINVLNPNGELVSLPSEQVHAALGSGYTLPTPEHLEHYAKEQKYGTGVEQLKTGLEGAASAATFGLSTGAEKAFGAKDEDIQGRREINPGIHTLGEIGGLGASLLTGVGEGTLLEKAGLEGSKALGLGYEAAHASAALKAAQAGFKGQEAKAFIQAATSGFTTTAKLGSAAAKAAIENAAFASGDEVSKFLASDPNQHIETAIADVGLAGLVGAGFGTAFGVVPELWKAAKGVSTGRVLGRTAAKLGGIEGKAAAVSDTIQDALTETGLGETIAPEVKAALSNDPSLRNAASILEQRDTTPAGVEFQASMAGARKQIADVQAEALGTKTEDIASKGELDKYTVGKSVGDTLAKEFDSRVAPLAKQYEEYSQKFAGQELVPSVAEKAEEGAKIADKAFGRLRKAETELQKALKSEDPGRAIEAEAKVRDAQDQLKMTKAGVQSAGTVDTLSQRVANLATREGWVASPSSDIMREVARVQKELPNLKTLKDLTNYIKQVGENTKSTLPFGQQTPVSRAGGLIKSILRDSEGELIEAHVGGEGGAEALEAYRSTQKAYRAAAQLKEAVDDRLGAGGSVAGYAKTVRAMAKQEGEKVLRRLLGTGDADWLALVQKEFPETAAVLKAHHVDALLAAAKEGDSLSSKKLLKAMDALGPQLRDFAVSPEAQGKIKAAAAILEQLNDKTHNFSNTARTADKLTGALGSSALGVISSLLTHNPALGFALGPINNYLGKTLPDAARLAMLKFLGSANDINAAGFKSAADVIGKILKGESLVTKATQAVFTEGDVLPAGKIPTDALRERLDKKLLQFQEDQSSLLKVGGDAGHYMPEHATAMGETSARVVNYVNSQRPVAKKLGTLDPEMPPSDLEKDHFKRVLDIAQQPLVVIQKVKDGTVLTEDVQALKAMYPKMYDNLVQKLTDAMVTHVSKEEPVPYHTRIGLSIFFGHPLDSTMTPEAIIAAQPKPRPEAQPGQATEPKRSTSKLGKLPKSFQTPAQAAEARRQSDK